MKGKIKYGIISFFIVLILLLPSFSFSNSFAISFEAIQNEAYTGEAIHFKVSINDYKEENKEQWYYYIFELGDGSKKTGFANTNPFYISCAYSKEGIYYPKFLLKMEMNGCIKV
ncbi:MAG: hypothetical protein QW519_04815 [Candidatus Thermoplasmatota archaeon]